MGWGTIYKGCLLRGGRRWPKSRGCVNLVLNISPKCGNRGLNFAYVASFMHGHLHRLLFGAFCQWIQWMDATATASGMLGRMLYDREGQHSPQYCCQISMVHIYILLSICSIQYFLNIDFSLTAHKVHDMNMHKA